MKRKWAYLGALLPFSTAVSAWTTGTGAYPYDGSNKLLRPKNNASEDKNGSHSPEDGDGGAGEGDKSAAHAPSGGAYDGETADKYADDDLDGLSSDDAPKFLVSGPGADTGMYAPAGGGGTGWQGYGGRGGSVSVTAASDTASAPAPVGDVSDPADGGPADGPGDTGYVEPDPADADAMMILLGGTATGTGAGAMSSGEVDLEIVDYGWYTVGHGYAKYSASGSDGSAADTFAAVEGADLVFLFDFDYALMGTSYSVTYVYALDFEEDHYAQMFGWNDLLMPGPFAEWFANAETDVSIDGNSALLSINTNVQDGDNVAVFSGTTTTLTGIGSSATAWLLSEQASLSLNGSVTGVDTLVSATGSLVEIEDQFSSVSGVVIGIG